MLSRISTRCYILLMACAAAGGCCCPGSLDPICRHNYPNLMGYTYPNWQQRNPLITPPNGPQDGLVQGYLPGTHVIEHGAIPMGATPTPSFGPQAATGRVPTAIASGTSAAGESWRPSTRSATR